MTPEDWRVALEKGGNLAPIKPHHEVAAVGALRVHLAMTSFQNPVAALSDPRYLADQRDAYNLYCERCGIAHRGQCR